MKLVYTLMLFAHVLGIVIWVGGMILLLWGVRPALESTLEASQRVATMAAVAERFFAWAGIAIALILASGLAMIFGAGGFRNAHVSVHLMFALGLAMMAIYLHARFAPLKRLRAAIGAGDSPAAAKELAQLRQLMTLNCALGIVTIAVATVGRTLL